MIKISAVSYLNTFPFIYGLNKSKIKNEFEIFRDVPAICAEKLISNQVDIGLVPVAVLPQLSYYNIITNYCIGAVGKVYTVLLLSHVPLNQISEIYLDNESRTSVQLVKVLAENFWKIKPDWINIKETETNNYQSVVLIGDKTFTEREKYPYVYDLAEEWCKFTSLPFVFACWVANKPIPEEFNNLFNKSLQQGVENIDEVIKEFKDQIPENVNAKEYYTEYISYNLDDNKRKGLNLFLSFLEKMK
jgi:chorismate dehydratase